MAAFTTLRLFFLQVFSRVYVCVCLEALFLLRVFCKVRGDLIQRKKEDIVI